MYIKMIMASAAIAWLVSGCSFSGQKEDYQRASAIKTLEYPQDIDPVELPPLYPIPQTRVKEEAFYNLETDGFVVPRPEPMSAEREQAKIKIQKVGSRRWILAEASTSQVWPLAQNFLMQVGIDTLRSLPATGLVESDWVEFKDDDARRHQFRIRIEQGLRADTTEIHVLGRAVAKNAKVPSQWPTSSDQPSREDWVLDELANSLAGNIGDRAASLLGQKVGGEVKAELFMAHDEPAIRLQLDRLRAWATVAHGVTKEGFRLWDEDSDRLIFYVQHDDLLPKRNWFTRKLFGESKVMRERPYPLAELLLHMDQRPAVRDVFDGVKGIEYGPVLKDGYGILVILKVQNDTVLVKVRDYAGRVLPLAENKKLLAILRRNLI